MCREEKLKHILKYYDVINYISDNKKKVTVKCNKCGIIEDIDYCSLKNGRKCQCVKRNKKFSQDEASVIFKENGFILLDEYINANTNNSVKCIKCGIVYSKKMGNVKKGCTECKGVKKYTYEEVCDITKERKCTIIGTYTNVRNPFKVKCDVCDYIWDVRLTNLLRRDNSGCHNCHLERVRKNKENTWYSIGKVEQEKVYPFIKKIFYDVISQYPVYIQGKKSFPYSIDFYIPSLNLAIEFDEKYHKSKNQKEKDNIRQLEIEHSLGCDFYRIDESMFFNNKNEIETQLLNIKLDND